MAETIRVLCVDDEINILNVIKRQLHDEDMEVFSALSAAEGLRFLRQAPPIHVVLSDFRMPGINGVEFLREAAHLYPATVGLILSGFADIPAVRDAQTLNHFHGVIAKPWRAEQLRAAIREAAGISLERRKAINALLDPSGEPS